MIELLVVAFLLIGGYLLEERDYFPGVLCALGCGGVGWYVWGISPRWLITHPLVLVKACAIYLTLGILWSFVRWVLYLRQFRAYFRELKSGFVAAQGLSHDAPLDKYAFSSYVGKSKVPKHYHADLCRLMRPQPKKHKGLITSWITMWPYSIVGHTTATLFRDLISHLFNRLKGLYQRLSLWFFRNDKDLL